MEFYKLRILVDLKTVNTPSWCGKGVGTGPRWQADYQALIFAFCIKTRIGKDTANLVPRLRIRP